MAMTLPASSFPLSVSGAKILGADGRPVRLCGVNWGGAQQNGLLPYGLDKLPRAQIIDRITGWGFNHVRFPFALGTFVTNGGVLKTGEADKTGLAANPDLIGATPWEVYQVLVAAMTAAGLYVIPNQHLLFQGWCCSNTDDNGLWYNGSWPQSTFARAWNLVTEAFKGNPRVGYDLHNEPRPASIGGKTLVPTWGTGAANTDMRLLYQDTAAAIRSVHPGALVFCEGLSYASDLTEAGAHPVTGPGVVYSAHDYPWFHPAGQTLTEYYDQMDSRLGYLITEGKAPVWIGEFGTNTDAPTAAIEGGWFAQFLSYAQARQLHTCWWELNATSVLGVEPVTNVVKAQPGSRETYGLMSGQDWLGSQTDVIGLLRPLMT